MKITYKCKFCNKELLRPCALAIHERTCCLNPNRKPLVNCGNGWVYANKNRIAPHGTWKCKWCEEIFKTRQLLFEHNKICVKRSISFPYQKYIIDENGKRHLAPGCTTWNKGLTKETDERLLKSGKKLSNGYKTGRLISTNKGTHHTEEERKHLSEMRKKYLQEHPDQVPYVLNHHSKGDSYPEKYFKEIFDNKNIQYEQNYKTCGYFLDFAWPKSKIYLEIDGEQHYLDKRIILHDKKRTEKLSNAGWRLLKRIRWSNWQKLKTEEKENEIYRLLQTLKIQNSF